MGEESCSVFEYLYRDAANYKAWGALLLRGPIRAGDVEAIRGALDGGERFVAEDVGVPPLYERLWAQCGTGYAPDLDHLWHEFYDLRPATSEECAQLPVHCELTALIDAFSGNGVRLIFFNQTIASSANVPQRESLG